jgi:hypothetical protein
MNTDLRAARLELQRRSADVDVITSGIYANPLPAIDAKAWALLGRAESARQEALANLHNFEAGATEKGLLLQIGKREGSRVMGRETTGIEARASLRLERVPTGIVHLLDKATHPLVTFEIENLSSKTRRLRLTTYVEGYSASAVDTVEIPKNGKAERSQLVTFFPGSLRHVTELTRATLHVKVDDLDGAQEFHRTEPIWLLARDSAYLSVWDPSTAELVDLTRYLVAWVTPHVEDVLRLLRSASTALPSAVMAGYQGDSEFVQAQVNAVYETLRCMKIAYVNTTICFGAGIGEYMQRIRLPRETVATRSANCIDGTVLFASILEAASLCPAIVLVPGHAFLAWQVQEGGEWDYLETTLVGTSDFESAQGAARDLVLKQKKIAGTSAASIRHIAVSEMRAEFGITPME